MKKIIYSTLIFLAFSCTSIKQIGQVNMISNRNIDPKLNYEAISRYSGGSKKELKRSRAVSIQDAIDNTVRKIPGGEFLMNVKIYSINEKYIAVEGDVWGQNNNITFRGFEVGDEVTWKVIENFKSLYKTGLIRSLKDDKTCLIEDENGQVVEKKYDEITKAK